MRKEVIYKKIIEYIKSEVINGNLSPNQKISTEAELSKMFNTSRNTVIKAMDILNNEGYIYRMQGKGSFISDKKINSNMSNTKIISLILPFSNNDSNRIDEINIIRGVENYLKSNNYNLMIHYGTDDPKEEARLIDKCRNSMIDGVIVYPTTIHNNLSFMYDIILDKYPIVFIDRNNSHLSIDSVQSDNVKGGFIATNYLISKGYEDIYFVSDVVFNLVSSVRDRYFGYCKALKQSGKNLDKHLLIDGYAMNDMKYKPCSYEENPYIFNEIINRIIDYSGNKKIGVFTDNDLAAYSIIKACIESSLKIGENIGVIGYNDADIASKSIIPITTVKQNFFEIGRISAKTLLEKMKNPESESHNIFVDVELIIRNSTHK